MIEQLIVHIFALCTIEMFEANPFCAFCLQSDAQDKHWMKLVFVVIDNICAVRVQYTTGRILYFWGQFKEFSFLWIRV
jgi:hypothetical protein